MGPQEGVDLMADDSPNPSLSTQLLSEMRRSNDGLVAALVAEQKNTTAAINDLTAEMRALRAQAPGRGNVYLASSIVILALVSILGLMSTRGVNVRDVADAATTILPTAGATEPAP